MTNQPEDQPELWFAWRGQEEDASWAPAGPPSWDDAGRAFRYGDGVFETMRRTEVGLPLWAFHLDRLRRATKALALPLPHHTALQAATQALLPQLPQGVVWLYVVRPNGQAGGYTPPPATTPALWLRAKAQAPPLAEPLTLAVVASPRLTTGPLTAWKTLNALPYVLAQHKARLAGAEEALMLGEDGTVAETAHRNLMGWLPGTGWWTPSLAQGGVHGVGRAALMKSLARQEAPPSHRPARPEELRALSSLWAVNALGVRPVAALLNAKGDPLAEWPEPDGFFPLRLDEIFAALLQRAEGGLRG